MNLHRCNIKKKIIILFIVFYSLFFNKEGYSHAKYNGKNIGIVSTHNFYTNESENICTQSFEEESGKQLLEKSDRNSSNFNREVLSQRRNLYFFLIKTGTSIQRPYYSPLQGLSVPLPNKEITTRDTISFVKIQYYFTQDKGVDGSFYTNDDQYSAKKDNVLDVYNTEQNGTRISNVNSNTYSALGINGIEFFEIDINFLVIGPEVGIYGSLSEMIELSFVFNTTGELGGMGEEVSKNPIFLTIGETQLEIHTKSNELIRPVSLR